MSSSRFTLRQLEIFSAVVRTGQVRSAAGALHLSQAAVSQALKELAEALDVTLFERRGRALVPTATARQLLHLAGPPMGELAQLSERLHPVGMQPALAGQLRLAASSTITRYILPSALAVLRQNHPALEIAVTSGNSATTESRVADLWADFGLIEGPSQCEPLQATGWGTDTLQIIAPPGYAVGDITPANLHRHAWLAREAGSGTRAVFEQTLALAGVAAPRAQLIMDDSGAIVRAVAAGAGLACVSRLAATQASALSRVQFVDVPALALKRPLWRVARRGAAPSLFVSRVMAALDEAVARGGRV